MGCAGSSPAAAADDTVRSCKERRRLISVAARCRRALASTHIEYLHSLRLAGAALSRFAAGEHLVIADHTPSVAIAHRPVVPLPPASLRALLRRRRRLLEAVDGEEGREETEGGGGSSEQAEGLAAPAVDDSWTTALATATEAAEVRTFMRHRSVAEVAAAVEEFFSKSVVAGDPASNLLEAVGAPPPLRRDNGFGLKSILRTLCFMPISPEPSSRRHPRPADAAFPGSGLSSTLAQLLVWEKKLHEQIKVREKVKIKHHKIFVELQSQEYSQKEGVDLHQLKAAMDKLQSLLRVASLAAAASSTAIAEIRDHELAQQLVDLFLGIADMWRSMRQAHEIQEHVVRQLAGLVGAAATLEPTSHVHHMATRELEDIVALWGASFHRLVKWQREFVRAVLGWLELTLLPMCATSHDSQAASEQARPVDVAVELKAFCDEWLRALDHLPYGDVIKAIRRLASGIHAVYRKQSEELRIGSQVRRDSRELERRCRSLRNMEKNYHLAFMDINVGFWHRGRDWHADDREVVQARDEVVEKKEDILILRRKVDDRMHRHAKAVDATRMAALDCIQRALPPVFVAVAEFSGCAADALESVCRRALAVRQAN